MAAKLKWVVPVGAIVISVALVFALWVVLFAPDKGTLKLTCQKTIELKIDDKSYGTDSNFEIKLGVGSHEYVGLFRGQADQVMKITGTFTIIKDSETNVSCGADPVVEINSDPQGADVSIVADNAPTLGRTPVRASLPPGTYTFVINLGGQARQEGPVEINFDQTKKIDVFFGKAPKKGSSDNDALAITSIPEGVKIYDASSLVGVAPVSFPSTKGYFVEYQGSKVSIPNVFDRQNVWIHPGSELFMAISAGKISSSSSTWFANGGFFNSFVENGFLKINLTGGQPIQVKLPDHDRIIALDLNGSTIRFAGVKGSKLVMAGFDPMTGKQSEIDHKADFAIAFSKSLQSQDGTTTRFFVIDSGKLYELDLEGMNFVELGKCSDDMLLQRMGETSDFGVGLFSADGLCHGIVGTRYQWYPQSPVLPGIVQKAQPALMCFSSGENIFGFNTGSGSVEWQSTMAEEALQLNWNETEQVWTAESMDSKRYYQIDPNDGQIIPLDSNNSIAQKNPFPGYRILSYANVGDNLIQLFYKPGQSLMAASNATQLWAIDCSQVFSTKAFNPNLDVGTVCAQIGGLYYIVDLKTGQKIAQLDDKPEIFLENGAIKTSSSVWSGTKKIFYGSSKVYQLGNSLKVVLNDGSSCVMLP